MSVSAKKGKGIEILEKIQSSNIRSQRTLNLNTFIYLSFVNFCGKEKHTVSRVLDEVLSSFLDDVAPNWKDKNISLLQEEIDERERLYQANKKKSKK